MRDPDSSPDFETLVRNARLERVSAIGNAIASLVGSIAAGISRANAALWHHSVRPKSGDGTAPASG